MLRAPHSYWITVTTTHKECKTVYGHTGLLKQVPKARRNATNIIIMTTGAVLHETDGLQPRDPRVTNTDEWPEFTLQDVTVTLPDDESGAPTSLLLASEHHPLELTGRLQPVPKKLAHTVKISFDARIPPLMRVTEVRSFAYGAYKDGTVALWAAGKAGWFALKPGRAYRETYNSMAEAVNALFFVVDAYTPVKSTGKDKSRKLQPKCGPQEVFERYAQEAMPSAAGAPEAALQLYKHRDFLLSSMLAGKEGIAWSQNPFYTHLCRKFPEDVARIRQRLGGSGMKPVRPTTSHGTAERPRQASLDSVSTSGSLKRKRGRLPASQATHTISTESGLAPSAGTKDLSSPGMQDTGRTKASSHIRDDDAGYGNHGASRSTETPEVHDSQVATPAHDSDSDDSARVPQKGRSVLRLKLQKPMKGLPKTNKTSTKEVDDVDEEEPAIEVGSITANSKRKRKPEVGVHTRLTAKNSRCGREHQVDEGIDIPTSPSASDEVPNTPSDTAGGATDTSDLALRLLHKPDSLQQDVWVCALDGCTHKIYRASCADSQKMIREHYALHAYDDDERVRMVQRLQAPSLPINHLMEKVRMQAKMEGFPGSRVAGTRFPEPVRQRL